MTLFATMVAHYIPTSASRGLSSTQNHGGRPLVFGVTVLACILVVFANKTMLATIHIAVISTRITSPPSSLVSTFSKQNQILQTVRLLHHHLVPNMGLQPKQEQVKCHSLINPIGTQSQLQISKLSEVRAHTSSLPQIDKPIPQFHVFINFHKLCPQIIQQSVQIQIVKHIDTIR